jgi:hypothetical protein
MGRPDFDLNRDISDDESVERGDNDGAERDSNFITDYKIITNQSPTGGVG